MPLKLDVGLSRKVGEPNYGSRGASVNFAVEVESNLVREPDQLRDKIRYLFSLAKEAVEEELRSDDNESVTNGHAHGNGQSNGHAQRRTSGRQATASQVRALHTIATRQGIDLAAELRTRYSAEQPEELSLTEASELIDALKAQPNSSGGRR